MPRTDIDKRKSGGIQVAEPPVAEPQAAEAPPESLDKVRDILFGSQMRAVDSQLHGMEERLRQEYESLRADFTKQVESLDGYIRSEVQILTDRLAAERTKRAEELKALHAEIKQALRTLEKQHVRLEENTNLADASLRDQLLLQSQTDRATLAGLLTDVAARLTGGPSPGKNGPRN